VVGQLQPEAEAGDRLTCDSVLFDLDGTLWDASAACAQAWSEALAAVGRPDVTVAPAYARRFTGLSMERILCDFFPNVGAELHPLLSDTYRRKEEDVMRSRGGTLYPGTAEVLRWLNAGRRLFLVSNCLDGYIENFLRLTGLAPVFSGFESMGRTGKPKADNIASVVAQYGLRRPVYVGDTVHDSEAALANKIPFVFAAYGFGAVPNARFRIEAIRELPGVLDTGRFS